MSDLIKYMDKEVKMYCKNKCSKWEECLEENKTEIETFELFEKACRCRYYAENGK